MIVKLVTLWLASTVLLHAGAPDRHAILSKGISTFRQACQTWDAKGFRAAATDFKRAAKAQPGLAGPHYWLGTAHFHSMLRLQGHHSIPHHNKDVATHMQLASDALETAVSLDPNHAEAHAILATIYGMKIQGSLFRAIRYGHKVQKHHKRALEHGAKNPRVQYLLGAGLLHTADDERDRLEALKTLLLAEALFDAELKQRRAPNAPRWGRDACLAFIGQTFSALHKPAKAKEYHLKALRVCPNNQLAKAGLASHHR